jgi:hypothetical protein
MELLLQRFFPHLFLFQFFAAIVASAWYGGMGPAMLTVVVSILAIDYFFLPPVKSFVVDTTAGAYLASFVGERAKRASKKRALSWNCASRNVLRIFNNPTPSCVRASAGFKF